MPAKALRQDTLVNRVNYILHTLMGLGMLGMVWHQIPLPLLPQLLIFALASFWFLLQTVAHPAMQPVPAAAATGSHASTTPGCSRPWY
ncbi:DUF5134 domain-containing protein (plasmid) [Arthrobacter sp. TES]|nr:DUF5134 domain-containing protein [Arthrobacter sp. TES]